MTPTENINTLKHTDFIRTIIEEDNQSGKYGGRVETRFPPEPNGFLHIGHAKSICLNFGIAQDYHGVCHLRMDDTDPTKEDVSYVNSIMTDVRWLGFDWGEHLYYASDYFEKLYTYAVSMIKQGKAYVCSLNEQEIREHRGTVTQPGKECCYRKRSIEENLQLFDQMRAGKFEDGAHVLRAKIDMASPNMKMRDPLLYRIRHANHYRTGTQWCIYPMYDFAHCLSDYMERITHSICTLEFENNRELYDWILAALDLEKPCPQQYEFARLNLNYTVMSKRKLLELVESKQVMGWDDPRLPTISGLRRRGYTPESIRNFCEMIGIAKANSTVDISQLEYCIRDDLNPKVPRVLCVLRPLKVIIDNYPENDTEMLDAPYYPHDVPQEGSRPLPFSRELYIEQDDFMENPPKGYYRLSPGGEVRLRHAYVIRCDRVVKDEQSGQVTALHCTYFPETKSGSATDQRKVKGTIHWVSAPHAKPMEVRLYDRLFTEAAPEADTPINPNSLEVIPHALVEPSVAKTKPGDRFQFERQGYFFVDPVDTQTGKLVFNRIVSLKDSWAKQKNQ
jgi:glutaminyl-tRNA synthetase